MWTGGASYWTLALWSVEYLLYLMGALSDPSNAQPPDVFYFMQKYITLLKLKTYFSDLLFSLVELFCQSPLHCHPCHANTMVSKCTSSGLCRYGLKVPSNISKQPHNCHHVLILILLNPNWCTGICITISQMSPVTSYQWEDLKEKKEEKQEEKNTPKTSCVK